MLDYYINQYKRSGCYICNDKNKAYGSWLVLGQYLTCRDCQHKQFLQDSRVDKIKEVVGTKGNAWEILKMYDYNYFLNGIFSGTSTRRDALYLIYNLDKLQIFVTKQNDLHPSSQFGEYKCDILGYRMHKEKEKYISYGKCDCPHEIVIIKDPDIDPIPLFQFSLCHCDWVSIEPE